MIRNYNQLFLIIVFIIVVPYLSFANTDFNKGKNKLLLEAKKMAYSNKYDALILLEKSKDSLLNLKDSLDYLSTKSTILSRSGKKEESLQLIKQIDSIAKSRKSPYSEHYRVWSIIAGDKGNYKEAINLILKAISNDTSSANDGLAYFNLGHFYGKLNEFKLQEKSYKRGYQLIQENGNPYNKAFAANMMGMYYESIDSINIAVNYYKTGMLESKKEQRWDKFIDNSLNIARINLDRNDMKTAYSYLLAAERYFAKCITPRAPAMGTLLFVRYYMQLKKYEKASKYFELALKYSENVSYIQHQIDLYTTGIELYSTVSGNERIYDFFKKYQYYQKSNSIPKKDEELNLLSKIGSLTIEKEQFMSEFNHRKTLSLSLIIGLFAFGTLSAFLLHKRWKKKYSLLMEKKENLTEEFQNLQQKFETTHQKTAKTQQYIKTNLEKELQKKNQALDKIQSLLGIPSIIMDFNLGIFDKLNSDIQLSPNAIEYLQFAIRESGNSNLKNNYKLIHYTKRELDEAGINDKIISKYSSFFNLCINLKNSNFKISEIQSNSKYDIYYLCNNIAKLSPKELRNILLNSN